MCARRDSNPPLRNPPGLQCHRGIRAPSVWNVLLARSSRNNVSENRIQSNKCSEYVSVFQLLHENEFIT